MKKSAAVLLLTSPFLVSLFLTAPLAFGQTPQQVKVVVATANVRARAALDAEVIGRAPQGKVLNVVEKTGAWYQVIFSVDDAGRATLGYIHESTVAPVGMPETKPAAKDETKPPAAPPAQSVQTPSTPPPALDRSRTGMRPGGRVISGPFLKFGTGEHWLASLGYDYGLGRNFGLGLELQPYFESHSEIDLSIFELTVFLNAKAGLRLGFLKLYGGAGLGPDFAFAKTEFEGESFSSTKTKLAYHLLAGTELDLKRVGLLFEFQMRQIPDPQVEPSMWAYFFLVGLRF